MRNLAVTYIDIPGLEGKYAISAFGHIISHSRIGTDGRKIQGCCIKPNLDKDGYKRVTLCLGGRNNSVNFRVARLVAITWLNNPNDFPCVDHLDGNKLNDFYLNLEWVSQKENTKRAWKNGLCKPYDRKEPYHREGIIESNKRRRKQGI